MLSDRLSSALSVMQKAGVRIPPLGRLAKSAALLKETASVGNFPTDDRSLFELGNSIRDALDFSQFSDLLGVDESADLVREATRAMKGTVGQREPERQPYQFQSQLWVGAMLHYARLSPRVPATTTSVTPDYRITVVTREYGVEVKRPMSEGGVARAVSDAAGQLSGAGLSGVIAIDLSDCLRTAALERVVSAWDGPPYSLALPHYARLRDAIGHQIYDVSKRQPCPGYRGVMVAIVAARGYRWDLSTLEYAEPFAMAEIGVFTSCRGNLHHIHGLEIRDRLVDGLRAAGVHMWVDEVTKLSPLQAVT